MYIVVQNVSCYLGSDIFSGIFEYNTFAQIKSKLLLPAQKWPRRKQGGGGGGEGINDLLSHYFN